MTSHKNQLTLIANTIINEMFRVQKGDVIVISCDSKSNHEVVQALSRVAHAAGGQPVIMQTPVFKGRVALVDESVHGQLFVDALLNADIWIDANYFDFLYSDVFEQVMAKNGRLRYFLLGDLSTEVNANIYGAYDVSKMVQFCAMLKDIIEKGKTVRVTNLKGTDVSYEIEPAHFIAVDSGEVSAAGLHTPPALVNIVPRFGSVNGSIVFDALYDAYPDKVMEKPLKLTVANSMIVAAGGNQYASRFMEIAATWDEGGRKVAHMNFGLLPTVRELVGHVVVDERVWGITNWGFGSVSPLDAPPSGQPSAFHFDAICSKASVWVDDTQITADGEVVHTALKAIADRLK